MAFNFKTASEADRKKEYQRMAKAIGDDQLFTKKELNYLPQVLLDDEQVIGFASGLMDGNTWLISLTDKRVIFLDKGFLYGLKQSIINLDRVSAVSCKTGLMLGEISIHDGSATRTIKQVQKKAALNFTNLVRDAIEAIKFKGKSSTVPASSAASASGSSVIDQLERLAVLKNQGILTQAEFEQQKSKLLSQ